MKKLTEAQRKWCAVIGAAFVALFAFSMMAERWTVFLPSAQVLQGKNALFVAYFVVLSLLLGMGLVKGRRRKAREYFGVFLGLILFSWSFGQGTYNLIALGNAASHADDMLLTLKVVHNFAPPEGVFSGVHTIEFELQEDADGTSRPVRYRYREIQFRGLRQGDVVQVLARPGWAGYTLKRVIPHD